MVSGINTFNDNVQRELRFALDVADEKPEGTIFVVPLKMEECPIRIAWLGCTD